MKRWLIIDKNGYELKLYYPTIEIAQEKNKDAVLIVEYNDMSYIQYINRIIDNSYDMKYDNNGDECYFIHNNTGYIIVKLFRDNNDEIYYDYCQYQRHDIGKLVTEISFTMSNPKAFCDKFWNNKDKSIISERLSMNEFKKIKSKPAKFYNKNGKVYWVDNDGYFYISNKIGLSNKKDRDEWDEFHSEKDAILVKWNHDAYGSSCKWFHNIDEFMLIFEDVKNKQFSGYQTPRYEILSHGYNRLHPDDRKNIFRLPWINLDMELKTNNITNIARMWNRLYYESHVSKDGEYDMIEVLEDVITNYMNWRK